MTRPAYAAKIANKRVTAPETARSDWDILNSIGPNDNLHLVATEEDADALRSAGFANVINYPENWLPSYFARAAETVLWSSHDAASRQATFTAATEIMRLECSANVSIYDPYGRGELPLSDGNGISERVAALRSEGLGFDEIDVPLFYEQSPIWRSSPKSQVEAEAVKDFKFDFASMASTVRRRSKSDDQRLFVWDGVLPIGSLCFLVGSPKSGKSTIARNLTAAVSAGEPFLERCTAKGRVCYLSFEGGGSEQREQLAMIAPGRGDQVSFHHTLDPGGIDKALATVEKAIVSLDPVLVIVDTFGSILGLEDSDDRLKASADGGYFSWTPMLRKFARIADAGRSCLLFLHHKNRSGGFLGSQAIKGTADIFINLDGDERKPRYVTSEGRVGSPLPKTRITVNEAGLVDGSPARTTQAELPEAPDAAENRILAVLGDGRPHARTEVKLKCRMPNSKLSSVLKSLQDRGMVQSFGTGKRNDPMSYALVSGTAVCP